MSFITHQIRKRERENSQFRTRVEELIKSIVKQATCPLFSFLFGLSAKHASRHGPVISPKNKPFCAENLKAKGSGEATKADVFDLPLACMFANYLVNSSKRGRYHIKYQSSDLVRLNVLN